MVSFCLFACFSLVAEKRPVNWHADYPPCNRHSELLKHGPMDLGIRIATANPLLARQFRHAMDFWSGILDLDWHEEDSQNCSLQLLDGAPNLFEPAPETMAARSQFPDRGDFQGWIVFNPAMRPSETELFRISVHEIGHVFGLQHSTRAASIMYGFELEGPVTLDPQDLAALGAHHKLRTRLPMESSAYSKPR